MNSKKILLVEDEEVIRNLCKRLLTKMGHDIAFASGVKEAMDKIQGMQDLDLLVTDIKLPDGDGIQVMRCFRQKYPSTAVLIITGSPSPETRPGELQEMGFSKDDILFKPFEIKEFESRIHRCFEESQNG